MGDKFKLDSNGTCQSCNVVAVAAENLQCFMCKTIYHCACPEMGEDDKVGTKLLINSYNWSSTKGNFKFFCDSCVTKLEIDTLNSETNRLNNVEDNITTIKSELAEIKTLLKQGGKQATKQGNSNTIDNIWFNKDRLESTKVAPAEPMLVINNTQDLNNESVEKAIVDNSIPVTKSFKNNAGDLFLVCDTPDSCDKLKDIIASITENIQVKSVTRKKTFYYYCWS